MYDLTKLDEMGAQQVGSIVSNEVRVARRKLTRAIENRAYHDSIRHIVSMVESSDLDAQIASLRSRVETAETLLAAITVA